MHDVATGYFVPTETDTAAGFGKGNFGITTNIINGGQECSKDNALKDADGNFVLKNGKK